MGKRSYLLLLITICLFADKAMTQSEWRSWMSASVEASLSPKFDLRTTYLRSSDINNGWKNNFNQLSVSAGYDLTKRWSVLSGLMQTSFPAGGASTIRTYARLTYRIPISGILTFSNGIQAEWHSKEENRFRNRIIWISRIGNRKRLPFLNLNLSASYWLYYNLGGSTIRYFDPAGTVIMRQSPDGFHRGRLYLTASSRINRNFSLSVFYMNQNEFNLLSTEYRKINIVNPATGKTTRSFDKYNVAGLSLSYEFKTYSKKKASKNHKNKTEKNNTYDNQN